MKKIIILHCILLILGCISINAQTNIQVSVKSISVLNSMNCDAVASDNSDFTFEYRVDDNSPMAFSNNNPVAGSIGMCNYAIVNDEDGPYSLTPALPSIAVFSPTTGVFFDRSYNCKSDLPTQLILTWRAYENDDAVVPSIVPISNGITAVDVVTYTVPVANGTYTAQFTQTSSDGVCPQTYMIEFAVDISTGSFSPLTLNHAEGSVICTGSSNGLIEAAHTGGSGVVNYDWSFDGTGDFDDNGTENGISAGTYTVVVKDNLNCLDSATVIVEEIDPPSAITSFVNSMDSVCAGQSNVVYTVASQSNVVYFWNFSGAGTTINGTGNSVSLNFSNPSNSGTLSVSAQNGCSVTPELTMTVAVLPLPSVSFTGNSTTCDNVSQTITASGASSYTWSTGATTSGITVSPTITTVYSVQASDVYGCKTNEFFTLNVLPSPTLQLTGSTVSVCPNQTVSVNASGNGSLFIWSDGFVGTNHVVQAASSTIYTVTNTFANSCYAQETYTLHVFPGPNLAISGNTIVCDGAAASFSASGAPTYSWSSGEVTPTITFTPVTSGTLSLLGTTNDGCKDSLLVNVNVVSSPTVSIAGNDTICQGQTAMLTASANGTVTYGWNSGHNTPSINVSPSGTFTYVVTAFNGGCSATAAHEVFVRLIPTVDFTVTPFMCTADPAYTLVATPSGGTFSGTGVSGVKFDPSIGSGIYPITYSVGVGNGCAATSTQTIEVTVCTGVDGVHSPALLRIFPNPAKNEIHLQFEKNIHHVLISDYSGKQLIDKSVNGIEVTIDLTDIAQGFYVLTAFSEDGKQTQLKFVKE